LIVFTSVDIVRRFIWVLFIISICRPRIRNKVDSHILICQFVRHERNEDRDINTTLEIGRNLLAELPEAQLTRIDNEMIAKYHPAHRAK